MTEKRKIEKKKKKKKKKGRGEDSGDWRRKKKKKGRVDKEKGSGGERKKKKKEREERKSKVDLMVMLSGLYSTHTGHKSRPKSPIPKLIITIYIRSRPKLYEKSLFIANTNLFGLVSLGTIELAKLLLA